MGRERREKWCPIQWAHSWIGGARRCESCARSRNIPDPAAAPSASQHCRPALQPQANPKLLPRAHLLSRLLLWRQGGRLSPCCSNARLISEHSTVTSGSRRAAGATMTSGSMPSSPL